MLKDVKGNIEKGSAIVKANNKIDLTAANLEEIKNLSQDTFEALSNAFFVGVAIGARYGERQRAN